MRTEPPVSVPMAHGTRRAATETPEPLLEPPGARWTSGSHGLRGVPMCRLVPQPPMANSTVLALPMTIIPASTSRRTSVAVVGETRFSQCLLPMVVTRPSMSMMSLSAMGMPCQGPMPWPALNRLVRRLGGGPRVLAVDGGEGVQPLVVGVDPVEQGVHELDRAEPPGLDRRGPRRSP